MNIFLFAFRYKDKPNISERLVRRFPNNKVVIVPWQNLAVLTKSIKVEKPDIVLGLGQAKKGKLIRIEKVAGNIAKKDGKTRKLGTRDYETTLSIQRVQGTRYSYDAGTGACNYTLYQLLKYSPKTKIGFLHVPKNLKLERAEKIVRQLIKTIEHNNI